MMASYCKMMSTTDKHVKIFHDCMIVEVKLERVTSKKDLGVTFDDRLNFCDS